MTRADWTLLILTLALLPTLYVGLWGGHGAGESVEIWIPGQKPRVLSLDRNQTVKVQGSLGTSVIEIRDHKARFIASPCTGKVCIHAGWQEHAGELAACLPNKVAIEILGRDRRYDSINF
jgi:hypothetical protein